MLSFVIHSKPVLACYSSPDRLPLLTSEQRKGSLERSAVTQREVCRSEVSIFVSVLCESQGGTAAKTARKKGGVEEVFICIYLKSQNVPEAVGLMLFPEVPGRAAGRSLFRQIAVRVRQ